MTELRGYQKAIAEATGVTDPAIIEQIETHMRDDIFHSTLDWQSKRQFTLGARNALALYSALHPDALDDVMFASVWKLKKPAEVPGWRAELRSYLTNISEEITA